MARRSLRPQLNQIRAWVQQGRTDAWIAHKLDVTVQQIETFKRENDLAGDNGSDVEPGAVEAEEVDLRAEDDALIAAELDKAEAERAAAAEADEGDEDSEEDSDEESDDEKPAGRRRGRRGGRTRRRGGAPTALEGTFDHGEEGYGLWLDPAVQDDPVYAEHWAGHRPVEVKIEADRIVISRAGEAAGDDDD